MRRCEHQPAHTRRALSLVEAVISMVIVGLTLVAALTAAGASGLALRTTGDRLRGKLLAQALMSEIMQQAYSDPEGDAGFGVDSSESGGSRADLDDVDDYHDWSASPPEYKDGTALTQLDGWQRDVTVEYASPTDLTSTALTDKGVKRVTVQVTCNGAVMATLTAVRTGSSQDAGIPIDPPVDALPPEFLF